MKGAAEALRLLRFAGYHTAVVTATDPERAERYLKEAGLRDLVSEIISAATIRYGKPAPDVYRFALEKLGINQEDALAVEDAPNGIRAAYRAGIPVLMVPDQTPCTGELEGMLSGCFGSLFDMALSLMPGALLRGMTGRDDLPEMPGMQDFQETTGQEDSGK